MKFFQSPEEPLPLSPPHLILEKKKQQPSVCVN